MQRNPDPTAQQQQVLLLLAQGKTVNAAAADVGIHRNTIANWRRSSESFRELWRNMQYEQCMHWRDELQSLAQVAVEAILKMLTDEKTPPSVRLRAALAVMNKVTAVSPAQPELRPMHNVHNSAQRAQAPQLIATAPDPQQPVDTAQSAQACTIAEPEIFNELNRSHDDDLDSLLQQMCMPPRMHNLAQPTPPGQPKHHTSL